MSNETTLPDFRRVLGAYVWDLWETTSRSWNRFWFTPDDPACLGLIRLLTGLMLLYTHFVWGLDFDGFLGPHPWLSPDLVQTLQAEDFAFSFWWWVPSGWGWSVHCLCLVILTLFAVGCWTRWTSILALLIVISYANRLPAAQFGLDQINGMLTLYLAIGPSGAAFSVDERRRRKRASVAVGESSETRNPSSIGANIAIRLIQCHMCLIYLAAGLSKLQGLAWWDGMAMWLAFANREYQTVDMLWLANYPLIVHALTHITVIWEISFCVLVWVPVLRPIVLLLAVFLHVGIGLMMGMWTFGLVMLVGCLSFVPSRMIRQWLLRERPQVSPV